MKQRNFIQQYSLVIKAGVFTGLAVLSFFIVDQLVMYRYIKLDYYLAAVAIIFLTAGVRLAKAQVRVRPVAAKKDFDLTTKETEILTLIGAGKTNKEIAAMLFVELSTIKTHINNIYCKLQVTNRKDAREKYAEITR